MSSIVADELAKIKSFETETEKRRSELTLNELNYISDKQLHKKDGGGSGPVEWDFLAKEWIDELESDQLELLAGDYQTFYEKVVVDDEAPVIGFLSSFEDSTSTLYIAINDEFPAHEDAVFFKVYDADGTPRLQPLAWHSDNTIEFMAM